MIKYNYEEPWRNSWVVIGFDDNKEYVEKIMRHIEECNSDKVVQKRLKNNYYYLINFTDGTTLRWIPSRNTSSRGWKAGKMWVDKTINKKVFITVFLPMYMGKREDIIWL